jgi:glycosyltransferase involved in cell wall biosynthesis
MKVLHLLSDWKWTGPAEPVVNLCMELEKRGHDVTFAYRKPPFPVEDSLEKRVRKAGVKATDQFHLNHGLKLSSLGSVGDIVQDFFRLKRYLSDQRFDLVNVHQSHDHILGAMAARGTPHPPLVIRTDHKRDSLPSGLGNRLLISRLTDGMITFSEKARQEDCLRFGMPPERVVKIRPALDLGRYRPGDEFKDMRAVFGLDPSEVVIGMIARFQKYRRTDVFLEAVKILAREFPNFKVLLVGRSSQMGESVVQPMKRLGIEPWVVLAGYRTEDYLDTLSCMDIFVFLMAGSDGTARALREAMAMGKPAVVARRGMLPELVDHGVSGMVVKDTPEELARATLDLLRNPNLRSSMGAAALAKAHRDFRLEAQAAAVEEYYAHMLSLGKWRR